MWILQQIWFFDTRLHIIDDRQTVSLLLPRNYPCVAFYQYNSLLLIGGGDDATTVKLQIQCKYLIMQLELGLVLINQVCLNHVH